MTSGRRVFQQHTEHAEGNDTIPRLAHSESTERRVYKPQLRQKRKRSRSPAGPRRLGAATRISASLLRRLSAFFGSTLGQGPKAAKYAVLPSGHAGFPERAKRSEGRDGASIQSTPVSTCEPLCAIFLREPRCVPTFTCESKRGAVCAGGVEGRMTDALETLVWLRFLRFSSLFRGRKRKRDKGLASEPTLCPITSARSAGS